MLILTPGLASINLSAAFWTASMRAPCVKECQKVISPSSGASDSAVEEASVEAAVLVSAVLAAVEEEPPQPASRDAAIPAASRDASAFFMCLTSCDQICCVLVCSCVFLVVVFLRKKMLSGFHFFVSSVLTVCLYYTVFTFPLPAKKMRKNKIIRSKFERIIFLLKNIRSNFVHNLQI